MKIITTLSLSLFAFTLLGQNSISVIANPFTDSSPAGFFWKNQQENGLTQRLYGDIFSVTSLRGVDNTEDLFDLNFGFGLEKKQSFSNHGIFTGSDILFGLNADAGYAASYNMGIRPFIGGEWYFAKGLSLGSEIGYQIGVIEVPEFKERTLFIAPSHRLVILTYYMN